MRWTSQNPGQFQRQISPDSSPSEERTGLGGFDLNLSDLTHQSGGLNLANFSPTKDMFFFQKYNLKASFIAQSQMWLSFLLKEGGGER